MSMNTTALQRAAKCALADLIGNCEVCDDLELGKTVCELYAALKADGIDVSDYDDTILAIREESANS